MKAQPAPAEYKREVVYWPGIGGVYKPWAVIIAGIIVEKCGLESEARRKAAEYPDRTILVTDGFNYFAESQMFEV